MKRTNKFIPNQQSFLEIEAEVRALALSGIDLSLVVDDQDGVLRFGANEDLPDFAFCEVVFGLYYLELLVEEFVGGEPSGEGEAEGGQPHSHGLGFALECEGGAHAGERAHEQSTELPHIKIS